jgi:hypothetical protein
MMELACLRDGVAYLNTKTKLIEDQRPRIAHPTCVGKAVNDRR